MLHIRITVGSSYEAKPSGQSIKRPSQPLICGFKDGTVPSTKGRKMYPFKISQLLPLSGAVFLLIHSAGAYKNLPNWKYIYRPAKDLLIHVARKYGGVGRDVPNLDAAADIVGQDCVNGKIRWWTPLPKQD